MVPSRKLEDKVKSKQMTQADAEKKLNEHKAWRVDFYQRRFSEWMSEAEKVLPTVFTELPTEKELTVAHERLKDIEVPANEMGRVLYELVWEKYLKDIGPLEVHDLAWLSSLIDDICFPGEEALLTPQTTH